MTNVPKKLMDVGERYCQGREAVAEFGRTILNLGLDINIPSLESIDVTDGVTTFRFLGRDFRIMHVAGIGGGIVENRLLLSYREPGHHTWQDLQALIFDEKERVTNAWDAAAPKSLKDDTVEIFYALLHVVVTGGLS